MELLDFPIEIDKFSTPIYVHVFSDIHRAAMGCDVAQLRKDIRWFKKGRERGELHFWLGGGDWSNAIGPKDKRHDSMATSSEFKDYVGEDLFGEEARVLAKEFRPISEWGLGIGQGNHELTISKQGFNPSRDVAGRLDLPYLGYSCIIRFRIIVSDGHTETVVFYWHHGHGAGRTTGGKANVLLKKRDVIDADVYGIGHTHEAMSFPKARVGVTRTGKVRLREKQLLFFNAGTYLKSLPLGTHADYGEVLAFEPVVVGHNGFKIQLRHSGSATRGKPYWRVEYSPDDFRWMWEGK